MDYIPNILDSVLITNEGEVVFAVLDSDGNLFTVSLAVLDSNANSFTVSTSVLDSDANSFNP